MNINEIQKKIEPILEQYPVKRVAVFGSFARGEQKQSSDIDFLIDIARDVSMLAFLELRDRLQERLGHTIDLVEYSSLKPLIRENVLRDAITIYDKGSKNIS